MFHYRHAWFHNGGPNRSRPSHRYLALRTGVDRMEIITTHVQGGRRTSHRDDRTLRPFLILGYCWYKHVVLLALI